MNYIPFSKLDLEKFSDELNSKYDKSRLIEPKRVDVYDIVDLLGARLSFDYLSPDRSFLGATVFTPQSLYVWPGNPYYSGMMPSIKSYDEGTIIIDASLSERKNESDYFLENFTVMHECFHYDKHREFFTSSNGISFSSLGYSKHIIDKSSLLYRVERQADYSSAAFLMPRQACLNFAYKYLKFTSHPVPISGNSKHIIKELGYDFGVNYSPIYYRLNELKIVERDPNF